MFLSKWEGTYGKALVYLALKELSAQVIQMVMQIEEECIPLFWHNFIRPMLRLCIVFLASRDGRGEDTGAPL